MLEIFGAGDKEEKRPKNLQIGGGPLRHRQEWTIIERAVCEACYLFLLVCVWETDHAGDPNDTFDPSCENYHHISSVGVNPMDVADWIWKEAGVDPRYAC